MLDNGTAMPQKRLPANAEKNFQVPGLFRPQRCQVVPQQLRQCLNVVLAREEYQDVSVPFLFLVNLEAGDQARVQVVFLGCIGLG